jgi:hypothetical protein
MLIIFLDIQGIVHKEFVPEGQTVHSACYWHLWWLCENVQRLRTELWWQKNWMLCQDNALSHTSFSPGNFWTKTTQLSSPTHPTFLFPWLNIKLKCRHFLHKWGDQGRIAGSAEQPHRTRLPGCT